MMMVWLQLISCHNPAIKVHLSGCLPKPGYDVHTETGDSPRHEPVQGGNRHLLAKNTKIQHSDGPDHQDEAYEMHVLLVELASESLQNAESFCPHAISFRFGFRIRSAAGHEKGCPAMKRCPAVDKTISGAEQLL